MLIPFKNKFLAATILIVALGLGQHAFAKCGGQFLNPITDVAYNNLFPIKIASIPIGSNSSGMVEPSDPASQPICICPAPPPIYERIGISISFWEPAHFVESVAQAWCFPSIGKGMQSTGNKNALGGSQGVSGNNEDTESFAQAHYFIFAPWALMQILTDWVCLENTGFDLAYITEIDPMWNDDELAFIINPEALLFANPIAQLSCVADSATTNLIGLPISALPHCVASGGSVYPLSGHVNDPRYTQASQTITSRIVYKLCREGLIMDPAINLCSAMPTPIWVKHNYRFQIAKPVRGIIAQPPGRTSLIWGASKNPPVGAGATDNFLYIVFRKRACCAF